MCHCSNNNSISYSDHLKNKKNHIFDKDNYCYNNRYVNGYDNFFYDLRLVNKCLNCDPKPPRNLLEGSKSYIFCKPYNCNKHSFNKSCCCKPSCNNGPNCKKSYLYPYGLYDKGIVNCCKCFNVLEHVKRDCCVVKPNPCNRKCNSCSLCCATKPLFINSCNYC
jgi:hypothetical protein